MALSSEASVAAAPAVLDSGAVAGSRTMLAWRLASVGLFCLLWEIAGRAG